MEGITIKMTEALTMRDHIPWSTLTSSLFWEQCIGLSRKNADEKIKVFLVYNRLELYYRNGNMDKLTGNVRKDLNHFVQSQHDDAMKVDDDLKNGDGNGDGVEMTELDDDRKVD